MSEFIQPIKKKCPKCKSDEQTVLWPKEWDDHSKGWTLQCFRCHPFKFKSPGVPSRQPHDLNANEHDLMSDYFKSLRKVPG